jgi:hypothetical protein
MAQTLPEMEKVDFGRLADLAQDVVDMLQMALSRWRCHINFSKSKYRSFSKCVLLDFNDLRDFKSHQKAETCRLLS